MPRSGFGVGYGQARHTANTLHTEQVGIRIIPTYLADGFMDAVGTLASVTDRAATWETLMA